MPLINRRRSQPDTWDAERPVASAIGLGMKIGLLTLFYFVGGWAGSLLALPQGPATLQWPASGIALAMLLLWSSRVWPGVWFGALLVNLFIGASGSPSLQVESVLLAGVIATGASLQALVGAALVRRYVGFPTVLESGSQIFRFIGLAGMLASTISPAVAILAYFHFGHMPTTQLAAQWLIWWVGDAVGVFLIAPLIIIAAIERRAAWRHRVRIVLLSVFASLVVGIGIVVNVNHAEKEELNASFEQLSDEMGWVLGERLQNLEGGVDVISHYFMADEHVEAVEFYRLAEGIEKRFPELVALAWVPRVATADLPLLLEDLARNQDNGFQLFSKSGEVLDIDRPSRRAFSPVLYVYPQGNAVLRPGLDVDSAEDLRKLMDVTLATGLTQRTPISEDDQRLVVGVPVLESRSEQQAWRVGVVLAQIDLSVLMNSISASAIPAEVDVQLADVEAPSPPAGVMEAVVLPSEQNFLFAGRELALRMTAGADYVSNQLSMLVWPTQLGTLLFAALVASFVLVQTGRAVRIEQLVAERTRELSSKNAVLAQEIRERRRGQDALARSEVRFRTVFENAGTAIVFADASGRIVTANPAFSRLLGYEDGELEGVDFRRLTHPVDLQVELPMFDGMLAGLRENFRLEKRYLTKSGAEIWVDITVSLARNADGSPAYLVGVANDINERKLATDRLRLQAEVFEHIGEAIVITDEDNKILSVNRSFTTITGYSADDVRGRSPNLLSSGYHDAAFYEELWTSLAQHGNWSGEVWDRRKNGQLYPQWLNISVVRGSAGDVTHHVAVFSDITERKAAEERIRYLAEVDALTNLPNRIVLNERLAQALEQSRAGEHGFAVLFVDIDRFKNINDSLGHSVGDALLCETAQRLSSLLKATDTVTRQGGDEFVILLPELDSAEEAAHLAEKVLQVVSRPFSIEQHMLTTTASVGIAMYPTDGDDVESLLKHADAAMYVAKNAGRNSFRFFTRDMNARVQEFLTLENDLRQALRNGELSVCYQPQYDADDGVIVGAEALVRWHHPTRGLVLPGQFIHIAEESGLIAELGEWVMLEACRQNRAWQERGLRPVPISVNLSAMELHRGDVVEQVSRVLAQTGLSPQWLELEVTESMLMQDVEHVATVLQRLREMGLLIALDDFGTGYSSLAYLQRFPLSTLKVDRSFVHDIFYDRNDAVICRAVIALGRTLGLRVVAEGVETQEQLHFLRENRCDCVQGSLFSWAVDADQFAQMLQGEEGLDHLRSAAML